MRRKKKTRVRMYWVIDEVVHLVKKMVILVSVEKTNGISMPMEWELILELWEPFAV